MKRLIFLIMLSTVNVYFTFSQNYIEGVVMDSLTQEPIPYVHIYSAKFEIATISNEEGKFIFQKKESNPEMIFSHLSYSISKVVFKGNGSFLRISMLPTETMLSEVVVSDAAYKIAKKVFDNLRNSQIIQFGKTFYRQTTRSGQKPIEFIEIFSDISFSMSGIEKLSMYQSRFARLKSEPDDPNVSFGNFSYLTFGFKILSQTDKNIVKPFSVKYFESFTYSIKSSFEKDGVKYAVIEYEPDSSLDKPAFSGSFTVNLATNSIINFAANTRSSLGVDTVTVVKDGYVVKKMNASNHNFKWVLNFSDLNGKIQLEYITVAGTFDWMNNEKLQTTSLTSSLIVFEKDGKEKKDLKEPDINQNDIRTAKSIKYNSKFWRDNPVVKRTVSEEDIISHFEKTNSFGNYFRR